MRLIGTGRTAEVFMLEDGHVLKLFFAPFAALCAPELDRARQVDLLGVPAPRVLSRMDVEGRPGIVYEWAEGESMTDCLLRNPMGIRRYAHRMAALQAQMHEKKTDGLPSQKASLERAMQKSNLDALRKEKALASLHTLPDGNSLCHMDFHPGNILLGEAGDAVIDWATACRGDPCADVCRTSILLTISPAAKGTPEHMQRPLRDFRESLDRQYLAEYLRLTGRAVTDIAKWQAPVAAARLAENVSGEEDALLELIDTGCN